MSRYRQVESRIWVDEKFLDLSHGGKLAFLYLLTSPNTSSVGTVSTALASLETIWQTVPQTITPIITQTVREPFSELLSKGLIKHDSRVDLVVIVNFLKYNPPRNPNVAKAWGKAIDLIPECALQRDVVQEVKRFLKGYPKPFLEGFAKGLRKSFGQSSRNDMPIQEQEQEQDIIPPKSPKGGSRDASRRPKGNPVVDPEKDSEGKPWSGYFSSAEWTRVRTKYPDVEKYLRGGGPEGDPSRRTCVMLARGYIHLGQSKPGRAEADITEGWWDLVTSESYPNARRAIAHGLSALWFLGQSLPTVHAVIAFFDLPETKAFLAERKAVGRGA